MDHGRGGGFQRAYRFENDCEPTSDMTSGRIYRHARHLVPATKNSIPTLIDTPIFNRGYNDNKTTNT